MSIASFIKSIFGGSEADDMEEQLEGQEEDLDLQLSSLSMFDRGMPVEVLKDFSTVLFSGRLGKLGATDLTVERIPGEMSLPIKETGSETMVRGYDAEGNPIILSGKVKKSSATECMVGDLKLSHYNNLRSNTRCLLDVTANVYAPKDTMLSHPQACQLVNISTGGACIVSDSSYTMGQTLRLRVELFENSGYSSYQCQVMRISERNDGLTEYGLLFAQLDKKKIEDLRRAIQSIRKDIEKKLLS